MMYWWQWVLVVLVIIVLGAYYLILMGVLVAVRHTRDEAQLRGVIMDPETGQVKEDRKIRATQGLEWREQHTNPRKIHFSVAPNGFTLFKSERKEADKHDILEVKHKDDNRKLVIIGFSGLKVAWANERKRILDEYHSVLAQLADVSAERDQLQAQMEKKSDDTIYRGKKSIVFPGPGKSSSGSGKGRS